MENLADYPDADSAGKANAINDPVNAYIGRSKLKFVDTLERYFQANYARQYAQYMRISLAGLSFLFAGSGGFDYLLLDGDVQMVWVLRYAICLPLLLGIMFFALTQYFMRYQQWVLLSAILTTAIAMSMMKSSLPDPIGNYYFTGLLIIQMAGLNILRLQFRYAVICCVLIKKSACVSTARIIKQLCASRFKNNTES